MLKTFMRAFAVALSVFLFCGPNSVTNVLAQEGVVHDHDSDHDDHDHDESGHVSELHGMRSVHAWVRASHKGDDALVFLSLENESDKAILFEGGECEHARSVELVGFTLQDGKDVYVPLAHMPIEAGQKVVLAPKSLALRLNKIDDDFHKGDEVEMHLIFDVGEMHVHVNVEAENAMNHSHAGHIHK